MANAKSAECFLDSNYVIALLSTRDQRHRAALTLADALRAKGTKLVTTDAVLFEIANGLAKPRHRALAIQFLNAVFDGGAVEVVELTASRFAAAYEFYRRRADKAWSLDDWLSFLVMSERGLTEALTKDDHFEQAGFAALLRDNSR